MIRTSHAAEEFLRTMGSRPPQLDPTNPAGVFIKPINQYPLSPMSSEHSRMYISMHQLPEDQHEPLEKDLAEYFPFQVLTSRLKMMGVEVAVPVRAFLSVAFSNPGKMVAFAHAIYHSKRRVEGKPYTMEMLSYDFPEGFPNEKIFEWAWDAQKVKGADNGYDLHYIFKATEENPYIAPQPDSTEA